MFDLHFCCWNNNPRSLEALTTTHDHDMIHLHKTLSYIIDVGLGYNLSMIFTNSP